MYLHDPPEIHKCAVRSVDLGVDVLSVCEADNRFIAVVAQYFRRPFLEGKCFVVIGVCGVKDLKPTFFPVFVCEPDISHYAKIITI